MYIVIVHISVKKEYLKEFEKATIENAENSVKEEGIVRFDFLKQKDEPGKFILIEVYRTEEDALKHKETEHYKKWRDTVKVMMAEPRKSVKYEEIFFS